MQIVIDIPDFVYDRIRNITEGKSIIEYNAKTLYNAIYHGTPLPKGKWMNNKCRDGCYLPCCSVCGESSGTYYEYNYCPNCGAKMEAKG